MMWETKDKEDGQYFPKIDSPNDGPKEKAVKAIIKEMIRLKPSDRLSINEVVERLQRLRAHSDVGERMERLQLRSDVGASGASGDSRGKRVT